MTSDLSETEDDDESTAEVSDIESVLGLCLARGLPQRMLRWHYRSRHQSLIAVSNSQFYENNLFIVPSPYTQEAGTGLRFHHVPNGIFDSAATGTNIIEAKVVAEAILRHSLEHPELSLGVTTFSVRQRRAIQDQLESLRRLNPLTEAFFNAHPNEPFFIKNLENVQGDERDVIFISVGYARNADGFFAMRFGPLGTDGGERRLNVLISRAKQRCDVFASITDEDIDLERAKGRGILAFKLFMHYARTGRIQMGRIPEGDTTSGTFEKEIAKLLQVHGYQVHQHVGISGLFIDMAIADPSYPGRYLLGIECDGPSYISARSARDRDRLRPAVLQNHGWLLHRIWSIDWLQRPTEQLQRTLAAVQAAQSILTTDVHADKQSRAVPFQIVTIERAESVQIGLVSDLENTGPRTYKEATALKPSGYPELHLVPSSLLARVVEEVVRVEGPVHTDEVVARLRSAWSLQRSGGRIQAAVEAAIRFAVESGSMYNAANFLTIPNQTIVPRDRSQVSSLGLRKVEMLPPTEVDAAVLHVVEKSLGGNRDEIIQAVSREFGFKATSSQLKSYIDTRINLLLGGNTLEQRGNLIFLNKEKSTTPLVSLDQESEGTQNN